MKKLKTHPLFAAAVAGALVFGTLAYGQDTPAPAASPAAADTTAPAAGGRHGPGGPGGHGHGDRLAMLSEKLGLTDAQKEQIKPILKTEFDQMKALKDDTTTPQDQKKDKFKSIHQTAEEQIKAILTPEQVQKLEELKKERREHMGGGPGRGGSTAPVTTGSSQ